MDSGEVAEIKRHFEVVAERLESHVKLVAEAVSAVDAKIDREIGLLREGMRTEFEETRAMIRLSYTELDRRVRTLEDSVSRLEARMQRLETH